MLDVKEYLLQVKRMERNIQQMKEKLSYHQEAACSIRSSMGNPNGKVQTNSFHNAMEDHIIEAYDLELQIAEKQLVLEQVKQIIINQIQDLENYRFIEVLFCCFILLLKQDDIAKRMECSLDYVKEVKKNALKEFEAVHGTDYEPIVKGR